MIKLIILDWDDTITIGSKEGYFACYHEAIAGVGVHLSPQEEYKRILAKWGRNHHDEIAELLKEHPELVEKACALYERHLFGETFLKHLHVLPGTRELLLRLAKDRTLCVVTGMHPRILREKVIPGFKLPDVFSDLISAYDLPQEHRKPSPFIVRELQRRHKAKNSETIVVGDAWSDIEMARNAGVEPIAVLTGQLTKSEAKALKIIHIVENIVQIEKKISELDG